MAWKLSTEVKAQSDGTFRRIEAADTFIVGEGETLRVVKRGEIGGWVEVDPSNHDKVYPIIDNKSWLDKLSQVHYGVKIINSYLRGVLAYPKTYDDDIVNFKYHEKTYIIDSHIVDEVICGGLVDSERKYGNNKWYEED